MAKRQKFYAVRRGTVPGVYRTWAECEPLVRGVQGAVYKSFDTEEEALAFLESDTPLCRPKKKSGGKKETEGEEETELDTVLVLSGVSTMESIERFPYRPKYILRDVGEIVEI